MKINLGLITLLLILAGTVIQSLVMVKSGLVYDYGMGFWGPNAHDGLWHISLINNLSKLDFTHPSFSAFPIMNYHFGFDLLVAFIHRLTTIPIITLYFQILPPLFSLLIGWLVYKLTLLLFKSESVSFWTVFFTYFGSSLGFIITLLKGQGIGGESAFWSIQPISFPLNPPFMLSVVLLLLGLITMTKFFQNHSPSYFFTTALIFGVLIMVKVYAGLIVLAGLAILSIVKPKLTSPLFAAVLIISLFIFLPANKNASSLVEFEPLWFPRTMMEFSDRVGWPRFSQARRAYMESRNYLKWLPAEIFAIGLFLAGNLGTRIIALANFLKIARSLDLRNPSQLTIIFTLLLIPISIIPTLLFIQQGNPWNIIQFLYYAEILIGFFAGQAVVNILNHLKRPLFKYSFLLLLFLLTLPTSFGTLKQFLPSRPPSAIPSYELEALTFLKSQSPGIVLTFPFNKSLFTDFSEPRPLFAYESIAYVSALSNHQTFLEDEVNLEISGYPWRERREQVLDTFNSSDNEKIKRYLSENNIKYIYLLSETQSIKFKPEEVGLVEILDIPRKVNIFRNDMI